jgi:proteasome beta subunit
MKRDSASGENIDVVVINEDKYTRLDMDEVKKMREEF